jgi:polysaccharide export outer membrane protein
MKSILLTLLPGTAMKTCAPHATLLLVALALFCGTLSAQAPASEPARGASPAAASPQSAEGAGANPHDDTFIIGANDVLAINVWKEVDLSRSIPVRSDGRISLPLVGELQAAGKTPLQLEQDIAARLKNYITDPEVTVMVEQINSEKFNILGQVGRPGSYSLTATTTIVDAIALAGGFRDFAKKKGVYILRKNAEGSESRIAFNYQDFIKGKDTNQNIVVKPHDTIIVP